MDKLEHKMSTRAVATESQLQGGFVSLGALIDGLLGRAIFGIIAWCVKWTIKHRIPTPKWLYYKTLRDSLAPMPFLYRNVEMQTVDGFVEIELEEIRYGSLFPAQRRLVPRRDRRRFEPVPELQPQAVRPLFERIRDTRRGLFLGQAGIGKTTLFRYSVLSLMGGSNAGIQLSPDRSLIPIYIPLKALSNSRPSPVVRYILDNNPLFQGRLGRWRLGRLARKNRLFLFLDGYDEIPIAGTTDFIVQELQALFAGQVPHALQDFQTSPHRSFYESFLGCRVWLSSRREFFNSNPLRIGVGANLWAVSGIGRHRAALVERIFDRHIRAEPEIWSDKLSAERFMQQLLVVADGSLEELSKNPLFLTIMCFVYVYDLRDNRNPEDVWRNGVDAIIDRCIEALLFDLDESKARGLPAVHKEALLNRRSPWKQEKLRFLEHLAGITTLENRPVVTFLEATNRAADFFSSYKDKTVATDILRNIRSNDGSVNVVLQIIYSGLLILAEKSKEGDYYDFPHRRFKEVLGRRYLQSENGCALLCERIHERHLAEFVVVYYEGTQWRRKITDAITRAAVEGDSATALRLGILLVQCLERGTEGERQAAVSRLIAVFAPVAAGRSLPDRLVELAPISEECAEDLASLFVRAVETKDLGMLHFAAEPLSRVPSHFRKAISQAFETQTHHSDMVAREMIRICVVYHPQFLAEGLSAWRSDRSHELLSLLYEAALHASHSGRPMVLNAVAMHYGIDNSELIGVFSDFKVRNSITTSVVQERELAERAFRWLPAEPSAVERLSEDGH